MILYTICTVSEYCSIECLYTCILSKNAVVQLQKVKENSKWKAHYSTLKKAVYLQNQGQ